MAYINKSVVITPSQITSDQNDYNPTGWSGAEIILISGDNGFRAITSFAAGKDGEQKILYNSGSYPLYIPGQHTSGTAANRVITSKDVIIYPCKSYILIYDSTSSRWRIFQSESFDNLYYRSIFYSVSPGSASTGDFDTFTLTAGGTTGTFTTFAAQTSPSNIPVSLRLQTGTNSAGTASANFPKNITATTFFGSSHIWTTCLVSLPVLSDGTDTYSVEVSLTPNGTSTSLQPQDSVGFVYSHGTNSGKFQAFSKNVSGTTTADTGITVATNTMYQLRVEINKARTESRFYIDGSSVAIITGNVPASTAATGRALILKSAGTTNRDFYIHNFQQGAIYI